MPAHGRAMRGAACDAASKGLRSSWLPVAVGGSAERAGGPKEAAAQPHASAADGDKLQRSVGALKLSRKTPGQQAW